MRYLERDPMARSQMGDSFREKAHAAANEPVPGRQRAKQIMTGYYNRALAEYEAAIQLDPEFIQAFNAYGYTFWEWKLDWLRGHAALPPDPQIASRAEDYVREGMRLARSLRPPENQELTDIELTVADTMGEVLLAEGRIDEALEYLKPIVDKKPIWSGLNETRWDLAQTEICAGKIARDATQRRRAQSQALVLFADIQNDEKFRELRPLVDLSDSMELVSLELNCPDGLTEDPAPNYSFAVSARRYESAPSCAWSTVLAQVYNGKKSLDGYFLHVWGGGLNKKVNINSRQPELMLIETPSTTRHGYYFAQLEDSAHNHISSRVPFDTYGGSPKNTECRQNQLTLIFNKSINPRPAKRTAQYAKAH
jgi:tetratricopeptide (TPR) repeat protein